VDVALTTRPASADGVTTRQHHFVYAPVAVTSVTVPYWIDNPVTGQQESGVRLSQRLLAKLLTTSYNPDLACTPENHETCDPDTNPDSARSLFLDKDFLQLNPQINRQDVFVAQPWITPTVMAQASDIQFPVAAIPNAAGQYVEPDDATMAAALSHMVSDGSGTLQMSLTNKDPQSYPLTMVIYAMAPTSGLPHATAQAIASFLRFAAGAGQGQGSQPGPAARGLPAPHPRPAGPGQGSGRSGRRPVWELVRCP
jgi:hypothetical protein